jgi:predicted TPR repeat methyltransferase
VPLPPAVLPPRRHLELQPGHAQSLFWYAALTSSSQVAACPADMVAGLFDQYADHFDEHLVNKLGYKTPQLLL